MAVFDMGKDIPPEKPLSVGELISEAHKVVSSLIDTKVECMVTMGQIDGNLEFLRRELNRLNFLWYNLRSDN